LQECGPISNLEEKLKHINLDYNLSIKKLIEDKQLKWTSWTITKKDALMLGNRLKILKPKRILEIGCGISTVLLALYAKQNQIKVVSLEHKSVCHKNTIRFLKCFGLLEFVELKLVPIKLIHFKQAGAFFWYNISLKGKFDFVFIDGPPINYGRKAVLIAIHDHLNKNCEVWLHDGKRSHEQNCIKLWEGYFQFSKKLETIERGIWILKNITSFKPIEKLELSDIVLKFSIIMPTRHRSHSLVRTVNLIKAQTYNNWELIIIDNAGDVKNSFKDPRIRVYCHNTKTSASFARNQGIQYATGDLICFFDDDDDMYASYLERFASTFKKNSNVKMVRCGMSLSKSRKNYSYATPECCLRRKFATPTWDNKGPAQDQRYFRNIVKINGWSLENGDIIILREILCRANRNPRGGLRSGKF